MKSKKFIDPKAAKNFLKKGKQSLDPSSIIKGIKKGDIVALSKAITLCESDKSSDQVLAEKILAKAELYPKHTIRIGITGSPGVGKSTFIEALGMNLLKKGKKVAVLAVDPSSQLTKGSILGDKTRMTSLGKEKNAFIRPSAAGRQLGGVAQTTQESISLCEMAGYEVIIVETVGVGQSEIMVHGMTDLFLLLIQPGAGDELQGIKKGIVEMADIIVVNKADGDKEKLAKQAKASYSNAIHLLSKRNDDWTVKVLTCSALENKGISEVWDNVEAFKMHSLKQGQFNEKRQTQNVLNFKTSLQRSYFEFLSGHAQIKDQIEGYKKEILKGEINPFSASKKLLERIKSLFNFKS